jgi:hypothetical protein
LWGVLAVVAGALWLGLTLGVFPPGLADVIVRGGLPAVLIAVGLGALLRGRLPFSGAIALVLTGAVVVNVALVAYSSRAGEARTDQRVPVNVPLDADVTLVTIDLGTLATDVQITLDETVGRAVVGEFVGSTESLLTADVQAAGALATLTLREVQPNAIQRLEAVGRGVLTLRVPAGVGLDLALQAAQGTVVLNLDGAQLERLNLDLLRGDAIVTLPSYQPQSASQADAPANGTLIVRDGGITISVPDDVGARFELDRAGSALLPQYDERVYNYLVGDVLESRDYDAEAVKLRYAVIAPRGQIRITETVR